MFDSVHRLNATSKSNFLDPYLTSIVLFIRQFKDQDVQNIKSEIGTQLNKLRNSIENKT